MSANDCTNGGGPGGGTLSFYKAFLQIAQDNERVWKPFLGYLLLHQASERMIVAFLPSNKHLSKLSPKDILQLAEKVPSTVNSLVTAIGGAWVLFKMESFKVERSTDSLFTPYPPLLDQVFAAHSAFTMYDMWVMSVKGQEHFSVWIHHVLSFLGTTFMRHFKHAAFFPAAFTLTEGTVVVSNLVWILQKLKLDSGSLFSSALALRVAAFLTIRCTVTPFVFIYGFIQQRKKLSLLQNESSQHPRPDVDQNLLPAFKTVLLSLWEEIKAMPRIIPILSFFNIGVLTSFNLWWTWLCIKALRKNMTTAAAVAIHHI